MFGVSSGAFPLHGTVRHGSLRLSSGRFAFPLQFSAAIEWAGLFTRRYNCAASSFYIIVNAPQTNSQQRKETE